MNVVVVVDKDNTHFSYEFQNVKEPINDIPNLENAKLKLVIKNMKNEVIAVFNEWSLWKEIE